MYKFKIDFNELIETDLILLSRDDVRIDVHGHAVSLRDGMEITVFAEDLNGDGDRDDLVADGIVVRNPSDGWSSQVKWACRINKHGIRHASDRHRVNQEK